MSKRRRVDSDERDITNSTGKPSSVMANSETLIKQANALDAFTFRSDYINESDLRYTKASPHDGATAFTIDFFTSNDLPATDLSSCFSLIETTSSPDYRKSSIGWHPKRKLREMREPEMRYFIVRRRQRPNLPDPEAEQKTDSPVQDGQIASTSVEISSSEDSGDGEFAGFLSFMLTHDSTPSVSVAYVYEIHLTSVARGCGLGQHLMRSVEGVSRRVGVAKVMLTCFLSNTRAREFYRLSGFEVDACSPEDRTTRNKVVKVDYVILSKDLRSLEAKDATVEADDGEWESAEEGSSEDTG